MKAITASRFINKAIALSLLVLANYAVAGSVAPPTDIEFGLPVNIAEGHDLIEVAGPGNFGTPILSYPGYYTSTSIDVSSVFGNDFNFFGHNYDSSTDFAISRHGIIAFHSTNTELLLHPSDQDVGNDWFGRNAPSFVIHGGIWCEQSQCPGNTGSAGGNSRGTGYIYTHQDTVNKVVTITYDDISNNNWHPNVGDVGPTAAQTRFHNIGNGNFVVEMRYENLDWGRGAAAGWSNDDHTNFVTLDKNINYSSGSNINQPGVYAWMFVDGQYIPTHNSNRVLENSANGTRVGTLSATDPDFNDTFTYTLLDNAEGRFILMVEFGVTWVVVADGGERLDVNDNESHDIRIRVTDSNALTFDKTLSINVVKIPVFSTATNIQVPVGKSMTVTIPTNVEQGSSIPTITADGLPAWMSFSDNGDGTATLTGFPSFESTFRVTLTVTDGFGNVTSRTFNIKVTPEPVAPETSGTGSTTTTTVTVTDNDGKAASFGWLLLLIGSGLLARKRLQK